MNIWQQACLLVQERFRYLSATLMADVRFILIVCLPKMRDTAVRRSGSNAEPAPAIQPTQEMMMILHDYLPSGNGYKVRLLLHLLHKPYEYRHYDIVKGETRTPEFLRMNPAGKIPVLELNDGRFLSESNAILYYLAQGTDYWPESRWDQAQVLRWLNFEQYSHEPNIATPRFWLTHLGLNEERQAQLAGKQAQGRAALAVMDEHLAQHTWFAAERYTIADIALYAYTHVAEEGEFNLADYPNIVRWLDQVASHPNHSLITAE